MADVTKKPRTRSGKKIGRIRIGLNVVAQTALILFLVAMVNSFAFKHYARWDFSRAKELFDKYKVVTDESLLVLDYDGRNKTVKASEMADIDQSGMAFGEGPRVAAFKGEQAITSAMIDLVEGKKKTLGYVTGHKEPALSEATSPITVLKTFIENENIKFQELNLLDLDAIPSDVNAVMIVGPQYDFSEREMQVLRDFWDKQGRILVLVDPAANTPRLRVLLDVVGVKVNDDRH